MVIARAGKASFPIKERRDERAESHDAAAASIAAPVPFEPARPEISANSELRSLDQVVPYALLLKAQDAGAEFHLGLTLDRESEARLRLRALGQGRVELKIGGRTGLRAVELAGLRSLMSAHGLELEISEECR